MKWWQLAGSAVMVVLLSACSGLPTDSDVQARRSVGEGVARQDVVIRPDSPQLDAGPEEIAGGFLRAGVGQYDGYSVAREYLSGAASRGWSPDRGIVLLRSDNLSIRHVTGSQVIVSAVAVAEVDTEGHLEQLPAAERRSLEIGLSEVDGQWRITSLPDDFGLWLSMSNFERSYQARRVYFPSASTDKSLIPDVRWFPEAGMATALARAVIGPPPSWLTGVAATAVPNGTRLQPNSVSVSGDTATVPLSQDVLRATPTQRQGLLAALTQTLAQAPGVSSVRVTVGNNRFDVPGSSSGGNTALGYAVDQGPSGPAIVRAGTTLRWTNGQEAESDPRQRSGSTSQVALPSVGQGWFDLAAADGGRQIAAIGGDRKTLGRWREGKLYQRPSFGTDLIRPSFDGLGGLWVAGRALTASTADGGSGRGAPTIWVIDASLAPARAQPAPVTAQWLGDRQVLSMSVSPDGHRIALIVRESSGQTRLLLSGIVRNSSGDVERLGTPTVANAALLDLSAVTWADETTLGVVGRLATDSAQKQPISVPLDGIAEGLGVTSGVTDLVGSSLPQDRVLALTERAVVLARQGRSWERFVAGSDVAVPAS
ncbi:LpqB family beta-propeller domain-containing protein [Dermacoccaceae bacterium W4C1]